MGADGLNARLLGGAAVGALAGLVNAAIYHGLQGQFPTWNEVGSDMLFGAVFGLVGGFGEYGTIAGLSGGLADNEAINYGGKVAYDLVTGFFAELGDPEK